MKGHLFYVKTSGLSHEAQRIKLDIALGNPIHGPERFIHPWISHVHGAHSTGRNCKSLPSTLNAKGFGELQIAEAVGAADRAPGTWGLEGRQQA